jgi:hypothetical protein
MWYEDTLYKYCQLGWYLKCMLFFNNILIFGGTFIFILSQL